MIKITSRGQTDVGMKRDHNEDYFSADDELQLYVVCDGMGGHASGEVASRIACENIFQFVRSRKNDLSADLPYPAYGMEDFESLLLSNAVQYGNERVYIEGMKDAKLEGMGTTLVAMMVAGDRMVFAHVGDSRIYRYNILSNEFDALTRDHSLLNHKIDLGELKTETDIKNFKQGNVIVRAVGLKDEVRPEVQSVTVAEGDLFLLCSDGLSDLVDDWAIENVLTGLSNDLEEAASTFVRMANDRGGKDNITALLVRVDSIENDELLELEDDDHVTQPTMRRVDLDEHDRPSPNWLRQENTVEEDDGPYDDPALWTERNDYGDDLDDGPSEDVLEGPPDEPSRRDVEQSGGIRLSPEDIEEDTSAAGTADAWASTDRIAGLDESDMDELRLSQALYDLEVSEQVALIVLAKRLVVADGSISLPEMQHLNELSGIVGQSVFRQADQVAFPNDAAFLGFLNTVHRTSAQKTIFSKLLDIAVSDSLMPAESKLLTTVAETWKVPLPGGAAEPAGQGGPPPLPSARRAARVTEPTTPALGRRVGSMKSTDDDEPPSIIIEDEL